MIGRRMKPGGFTLVELMVVILIIALLIAILLPALARARAYARMAACASNMRQFGIGVVNYASEQDDKMLPVDQNYWSYLANYMGEATGGRWNVGEGGDIFRCGVDPYKSDAPGNAAITYPNPFGAGTVNWLGSPGTREAYSYAANYAAHVYLDRVELHSSNDLNTPFSYADTQRLRRLGGTAPDTILFIESWGECVGDLDDFGAGETINVGFEPGVVNRIMLHIMNPRLLSGGSLTTPPGWHMRPAIKDYTDTTGVLTVNALTRRFDPADGQNSNLAHHWLLSMVEARESYDNVFHVGVVNVLSIDGSVAQKEVLALGLKPVGDDPRWTRMRD